MNLLGKYIISRNPKNEEELNKLVDEHGTNLFNNNQQLVQKLRDSLLEVLGKRYKSPSKLSKVEEYAGFIRN